MGYTEPFPQSMQNNRIVPSEQWTKGADSGWYYHERVAAVYEDRDTVTAVTMRRDVACCSSGESGPIELFRRTSITVAARPTDYPQPGYGQPPPARGYVANEPSHPQPGYGQPPPAQGTVANEPSHPQPGYGQPPPAQGTVANEPSHPQPGYGQPPPAQGTVANEPSHPQPGYGQPPPAQGTVANEPSHPQPGYGQPPPAQGTVANEPSHPQPGYGQPPPARGYVANEPSHPQPGYGQPPPAQGTVANEPSHPQPGYGQPPPAQGTVANGPYFNYVPPKKFGDVKMHKGTNKWETSMLGAPCNEPCFCLAACCCPSCCTFLQRKRLLMDDWSRYVCCAGLCGNCNRCVCSGLEPCCLCLEVWCCLSFAVHGNRFMVLQHYNLENDWCDLMIVWCGCCAYVAHLMDVGDMSVLLDVLFSITIGCLLAQHEHQMKVKGYPMVQGMK